MSTRKFTRKHLDNKLGKASVGELLRSWRLAEEMSQKEFAKLIGISPANLCDIERGRKGVSPDKAYEIVEAIGYSTTVLVGLAMQEILDNAGLHFKVKILPAA